MFMALIYRCNDFADGSNTGEEFQQEFKPPPEGSATGVGKQERVIPAKDAAHDQEQIQHRYVRSPQYN